MSYLQALEVIRGGVIESVHHAAVAVVNPDGELLASLGSPETRTFLRSSAKPFQALALFENGGMDHYHFSLQQIAIICGSHSGTDAHVDMVVSIHEKVGISEADLLCGSHPPIDTNTRERLIREGIEPTPNRHNCSGKHSGMLALAKILNASLEDYVNPEHPVQRLILKTLAEICDLKAEDIDIGVDGCSVPTFAMSLRAAATAYARLADPRQFSNERVEACHTIWQAMTTHPDMVAGPARFDTRLMQIGKGRILSKSGAEGFQGIAIGAGVMGVDSSALGIAIKIADGDQGGRACSAIAVQLLKDLDFLNDGQVDQLADFAPREITNWRGIAVGELRPCFHLQRQA
jgi:L-asparaginase II